MVPTHLKVVHGHILGTCNVACACKRFLDKIQEATKINPVKSRTVIQELTWQARHDSTIEGYNAKYNIKLTNINNGSQTQMHNTRLTTEEEGGGGVIKSQIGVGVGKMANCRSGGEG